MNKVLSDDLIEKSLSYYGWDCSIDEGLLMALELLSKASCGYYNSHTEEGFLSCLGLMTKQRKPNSKGYIFISSMVYASSNERPACFKLMKDFRK